MRVFQIKREIDVVVHGDRTIQEYVIELEILWTNYDYFLSLASYNDPECKSEEIRSQERNMVKILRLNTGQW
jgi:hypothetical protein